MFDLVLNTPFICNANQLTLSKFFPNRLLKSENMFKLYAQKISTKYNKSCFFEKRIHAKFIILKGKLDLNDLTCPGLWRIIFQSSYHTSLVSRKQEIDETVNFQNFWKCLQINWPRFLWHSASHFQAQKTKRSDRAHEACCNGCQLCIREFSVALNLIKFERFFASIDKIFILRGRLGTRI